VAHTVRDSLLRDTPRRPTATGSCRCRRTRSAAGPVGRVHRRAPHRETRPDPGAREDAAHERGGAGVARAAHAAGAVSAGSIRRPSLRPSPLWACDCARTWALPRSLDGSARRRTPSAKAEPSAISSFSRSTCSAEQPARPTRSGSTFGSSALPWRNSSEMSGSLPDSTSATCAAIGIRQRLRIGPRCEESEHGCRRAASWVQRIRVTDRLAHHGRRRRGVARSSSSAQGSAGNRSTPPIAPAPG